MRRDRLPDSLQGDGFRARLARLALPVLVECAKAGRTIEYKQLRDLIARVYDEQTNWRRLGGPLGAIADAFLETSKRWNREIPPINALVVRKADRVPGNGINWYLARFVHRRREPATVKDRRAIAEEVQNRIFCFKEWDRILQEYSLNPVSGRILPKPQPTKGPRTSGNFRRGWTAEGESELHQQLKGYVCAHPRTIGLPTSARGRTEFPLPSGDRPDVLFSDGSERTTVEVKARNASDGDIHRGVFQCVKYRAILRAEESSQGRIPNGDAILVLEKTLPHELRSLVKLFGIRVVQGVKPRGAWAKVITV